LHSGRGRTVVKRRTWNSGDVKYEEYFYSVQVKTVHTAPWPHAPNKNVFSNCLNWPYDSPLRLRLGGRLFQTCGPVAAKVLSLKLLRVRPTTSVGVSAERSCLT